AGRNLAATSRVQGAGRSRGRTDHSGGDRMSARLPRLAALASFALVAALAFAPGAFASSGPKCHIDSQYGSTCIDLTGSGLRLKDVQPYYSPPNRDSLSHHKWALRITRYPCNPIGKTQRECRSTKRWLTR